MKTYIDFDARQYGRMICTSYTGGAAWLQLPDKSGHIVVACTPVEIRKFFTANPDSTVRGEFVAPLNTQFFPKPKDDKSIVLRAKW